MLPKLTTVLKLLIYPLVILSLIGAYFFHPGNKAYATDCQLFKPPELTISNPVEGQSVSGFVSIEIIGDEGADWVHIRIFYESGGGRLIYDGPLQTTYEWGTTQDVDGNHEIKAWAMQGTQTSEPKESKCHDVTVNNSSASSGDGSGNTSGDTGGDTGSGSSGGSTGGSRNGAQTSSLIGSKSTSGQPGQDGGSSEKRQKGVVEEAIVEEEIPVTIDSFDPDIFLKGSNIKLNDVKNIKDGDKTFLQFSGIAPPNTLVTLYIF